MKITYRINNPEPGMAATTQAEFSKKDTVGTAKKALAEELGVRKERLRLYGSGKELADADAFIQLKFGDEVTLLVIIRSAVPETERVDSPAKKPRLEAEAAPSPPRVVESEFFNVGDLVDAIDHWEGSSWFPGRIVEIKEWNLEVPDLATRSGDSDGLEYWIKFDGVQDEVDPCRVRVGEVMPRTLEKLDPFKLKRGDAVLVNFNFEHPEKLGFWYVADVEQPPRGRNKTFKAFVRKGGGTGDTGMVRIEPGVYKIRDVVKKGERDPDEDYQDASFYPKRICASRCEECDDDNSARCKSCSCSVCGLKNDIPSILLCDECNLQFHLKCIKPKPLESVPEGDWFCGNCKRDDNEVLKPGQRVKSAKFAKTHAAKSLSAGSSRDWGNGMTTAGTDGLKNLKWVPSHHVGKIRGIEVGMAWQYRAQLSAFGCHRPLVSGIHGRASGEPNGCFSIVLAGGYEDDVDNGDTVIFTGSGGRELKEKNMREAEQSKPQEFKGNNLSLAITCTGKQNPAASKGEAKDWRQTRPIRVFRASKAAKHSKFAPAEGIRYDGLYHVKSYELKKGQSGHEVYLFTMERNDPAPAPWTEKGKKLIKERGFEKVLQKEDEPNNVWVKNFKLNSDEEALIAKDDVNVKRWDECVAMIPCVEVAFLEKVSDTFDCGICHLVVVEPVNTPCSHLFCLSCLSKWLKMCGGKNCPGCRADFGSDWKPEVNGDLEIALKTFLVGYDAVRVKTAAPARRAEKTTKKAAAPARGGKKRSKRETS